jgi:cytidine deaminase
MEIPQEVFQKMSTAAREASARAYCPYSGFRVGAALLTEDGEIVSGCNIENASYGLSNCAERTAVFQAIARGARKFKALVVYTPTPTTWAPCGACRQVLNEFVSDLEVIRICNGTERIEQWLSELLPDAFGPHNILR